MADYNPNSPQILGQEWCPIREEKITFPGGATTTERGYAFTIPQQQMLADGRFYIQDWTDPGSYIYECAGINVYPRGSEALSGPVKRLVIPVSTATITGSGVNPPSPNTSAGVVQALFSPDDASSIFFGLSNQDSPQIMDFYFNSNAYSNELTGKRILGVNVLYGMGGGLYAMAEDFISQGGTMNVNFKWGPQFLGNPSLIGYFQSSFYTAYNTQDVRTNLVGEFNTFNPTNFPIGRIPLGTSNIYWSTSTIFNGETLPWQYSDIQRFEFTNANRYCIRFTVSKPGGSSQNGYTVYLHYVALEVLYCEETRVAVGGIYNNALLGGSQLTIATNKIPMRTLARVANPVIPPGDYVTTLYRPTQIEITSNYDAKTAAPWLMGSLRELYSIPSLASFQINHPFPLDLTAVGKTFTSENVHIIPQLSLHTTGGAVLTQIHPYGNQAVARVYGPYFAAQEVQDSVVGGSGSASYPWVRFYARRFGDTSIPLSLTSPDVPGSTASITPAEFDVLDEIVDGWKEITLPLSTPAVMGSVAGEPNWFWVAPGESAGNRWEVLGAWAPAVSGTYGNLLTLSPNQLSNATYDGTASQLMWLQFNNSMVSADGTADATLLFSQYPPSVSGFAGATLNQPLTYTTPNCATTVPGCIPSAMGYNRLSWTLRQSTAIDTFARTAISGWGSTDLGQVWTIQSGSSGTYSVNGSAGLQTHLAGATSTNRATINVGSPDVDEYVTFLVDATDTSSAIQVNLFGRFTDTSNYYQAYTVLNTDQNMRLVLAKNVAGSATDLVVYNPIANMYHNINTWYTMRFRVSGQRLSAKVWPANVEEPDAWMLTTTDSSLTTGNLAGLGSLDASTTGAFSAFFNNYRVLPPSFGGLELQRFDPVDAAFSTIMLATNPAITGFNDYEARVGQASVYRIRERNNYDFTGLWSPMVTATVTSPGVTGASVGLNLFTSNFVQAGTSNLAYSSEWEGDPIEGFTWIEGRSVTFQDMYNKDFPTAFHTLERGGEQFTRTILVNAAGIPPATSENGFENLRDLGWAALPYVCVRDELGNRWYSTILIPEGSRKRMNVAGHLNVASVTMVETTETPYPVNP